MLTQRQDRILQDIARSIAAGVEELGADCTARLLAGIALGLLDGPESEQATESSERQAVVELPAAAAALAS